MVKLFKKPQYKIYVGLALALICWALYVWFIPDVNERNVGIVKKNELVKCNDFSFSAQMDSDSSGKVAGVIDVRFDNSTQIPSDILLATDYPDWSLKSISVMYSYTLDQKQYSKFADDSMIELDYKSALGGISFRQPFPHGAQNRRIIFNQVTQKADDSYAEGYIAVGEQLHNCKITDGIMYSIHSQKIYRFGKVQLVKFVFKT